MIYLIRVDRESSRSTTVGIEAKNEKEAKLKAIETAHNIDFSNFSESDPIYSAEIVGDEEEE